MTERQIKIRRKLLPAEIVNLCMIDGEVECDFCGGSGTRWGRDCRICDGSGTRDGKILDESILDFAWKNRKAENLKSKLNLLLNPTPERIAPLVNGVVNDLGVAVGLSADTMAQIKISYTDGVASLVITFDTSLPPRERAAQWIESIYQNTRSLDDAMTRSGCYYQFLDNAAKRTKEDWGEDGVEHCLYCAKKTTLNRHGICLNCYLDHMDDDAPKTLKEIVYTAFGCQRHLRK